MKAVGAPSAVYTGGMANQGTSGEVARPSREASLVQGFQRGDVAAFGGIYEEYYPRVFRYLLVRIGNQAEAEDLASDVFVKAIEASRSFKNQGVPFSAWLFRIAHNLMVDHLRRRAKRPTAELDEMLPMTDAAPDDAVIKTLASEDVTKAMQHLTDSQRQAVALRFGAGLSIQETAEAMGKREGAIKALQHSAIQALRRHLARQGHEILV